MTNVVKHNMDVVAHMYIVTDGSAGADQTFTVLEVIPDEGDNMYMFCMRESGEMCGEWLFKSDGKDCSHIKSVHKYSEENAEAWDNFRESMCAPEEEK